MGANADERRRRWRNAQPKRWRGAAPNMGWIESVRFGETMRKVAGATEDVAEGIRAWQEKRKPQWRGR